jgi:hypothetical protein
VSMIQEAAAQTPACEASYERSDAFDMVQLWERPDGLVIGAPTYRQSGIRGMFGLT